MTQGDGDHHDAAIRAEDVATALHAWPYRIESITPHDGGWNSTTWMVATAEGRFVAKLVDELDTPSLIKSLRIAEFVAERGLPSGAPVRTCDGRLTTALPAGSLALLRREPGTAPDSSAPDQIRRAGRLLARAHEALSDYPVGSDPHYRWPWEWVGRLLDTIPMPEHVNAAARQVWRDVVRTVADNELTIGIVHGDPGLSCFLLGDDDCDAMIDWATTMRGPLLYDLACVAVMNTRDGNPQVARWLIEGYVEQRPEIGAELDHLNCLVKARWLANTVYFASRIERGIERGSSSPTTNQDGLAEAYAGLIAP